MTLGCLAKDYFPGPVTVTWYPETPKKSIMTIPDTLHLTSGLYSTTSYVTTSDDGVKQKFTCNVVHAGYSVNRTLPSRTGRLTSAMAAVRG